MDNSLTNNKQTAAGSTGPTQAVDALDRLLAQAHAVHKAGEITVVEDSLKAQRSYCRVAVVISDYGTHIEIGSRQGLDSQITWTFGEADLAEARALLMKYFK